MTPMRQLFILLLSISGCTDGAPIDSGNDTDTDTDSTVLEPLDGQGTLSGDCGVLKEEEFYSPNAVLFRNTIDFGAVFDEQQLTEGGQEVFDDGNLGGSSIWSEVFAFEILHRCERAVLVKTEGEINYNDPSGKKTDLLVTIQSAPVGVSVTRAFAWPPEDPYTTEQATTLLTDKLSDIPLSTANVSDEDEWSKQILHILAYTPDHASTIEDVWSTLDASVKGDTIVVVSATEGDDAFMY